MTHCTAPKQFICEVDQIQIECVDRLTCTEHPTIQKGFNIRSDLLINTIFNMDARVCGLINIVEDKVGKSYILQGNVTLHSNK